MVVEEQSGCHVLQPECAFGLRQRFTRTYKALTTCNLISIDKNETQRLTPASLIVRLNRMNRLATRRQPGGRTACWPTPANLPPAGWAAPSRGRGWPTRATTVGATCRSVSR